VPEAALVLPDPRRNGKTGQTSQNEADSQISRKKQPKKMSNRLKSNKIGKKKHPRITQAGSNPIKVNQTDLVQPSAEGLGAGLGLGADEAKEKPGK
jgi:hypothetical protein